MDSSDDAPEPVNNFSPLSPEPTALQAIAASFIQQLDDDNDDFFPGNWCNSQLRIPLVSLFDFKKENWIKIHERSAHRSLDEELELRAPRASADVKIRALNEGGREVFELLSDSEPEADNRDSDLEVMEALQNTSRSSSAIPLPDPEQGLSDNSDSAEIDARPESSDEDDTSELIESEMVWLDDGMSFARIGHFRPTRKLTVERMEYRQGPAAIYPMFHTPTGTVIDLSDQMYLFRDPTTKELYTLNTIIMNADNDSWDWSGGGSRQTALVTFAPGKKPVNCRRIRYKCVGAHACDQLDKVIRTVVCFELDSAPRDAIITAQQETRRREGNSPEERAVLWVFTHAHIINGMPVQGKFHNYPCPATRSIYVPKDLSIRKVLIVHNDTGHNHPMPALTKLSFGLKDTYRGCIKSYGVLGARVAKIDNAQSTKMLLDGKTPSAFAPLLHNKCVKRDMLHAEKLEKYPNGLGVDAIYLMYKAEILTKPLPEQYIHSYIEMKKGEIIILTCVPYLLKLLDDPRVTSFDGDTTYKGIEGKLNEWELTIFAKVVQRVETSCRRMGCYTINN
ncbi:hypothetical protein B0H10DRAFT_2237462 [Mycena sp. CBHHK59/15]|nr:hypothetical protein B0H10DRAFT_2237462 [Mycena sp. CBHHK59/15]